MTPSISAPKTVSRCALYAVGAQTRRAWKGGIKGGFMAVSLFISTPVQHDPVSMLDGVLGTVGQVQERPVRAPRVQKPHGENERAVQNPSYNTHDAR
jgi:hypothetical protein